MRKDRNANDAGMDADGGGMGDAGAGETEMDAAEGDAGDAETFEVEDIQEVGVGRWAKETCRNGGLAVILAFSMVPLTYGVLPGPATNVQNSGSGVALTTQYRAASLSSGMGSSLYGTTIQPSIIRLAAFVGTAMMATSASQRWRRSATMTSEPLVDEKQEYDELGNVVRRTKKPSKVDDMNLDPIRKLFRLAQATSGLTPFRTLRENVEQAIKSVTFVRSLIDWISNPGSRKYDFLSEISAFVTPPAEPTALRNASPPPDSKFDFLVWLLKGEWRAPRKDEISYWDPVTLLTMLIEQPTGIELYGARMAPGVIKRLGDFSDSVSRRYDPLEDLDKISYAEGRQKYDPAKGFLVAEWSPVPIDVPSPSSDSKQGPLDMARSVIDSDVRTKRVLREAEDIDGSLRSNSAAGKSSMTVMTTVVDVPRTAKEKTSSIQETAADKQKAAEREAIKKREAAREEAAKLEAAQKEAAKLEAVQREAARKESRRLEAAEKEAARKEARRLEAARREARRLNAAQKDAARKEARRLEKAQREARRLEAAKLEAAQREAARKEAAKLEAERLKEIAQSKAAERVKVAEQQRMARLKAAVVARTEQEKQLQKQEQARQKKEDDEQINTSISNIEKHLSAASSLIQGTKKTVRSKLKAEIRNLKQAQRKESESSKGNGAMTTKSQAEKPVADSLRDTLDQISNELTTVSQEIYKLYL